MADLFKAIVLFGFGCVLLLNLGDAFDKKSGGSSRSAKSLSASVAGLHAAKDSFAEMESETGSDVEKPLPVTKPIAREGSHAQVCATFDPVAHPEQVLDILEYASQVSGTPVDVLYAIWRNETGHVDGAGKASGGCDFLEQAKVRCVHGRGIKLARNREDGSIDWNDIEGLKKCSLYTATAALSKRFSWTANGMTCSCGTATRENDTGYFGGCCGPFQFTSDEIDKNALAHGLDPMTFCGGAILAGWELKDHHDRFLSQGSSDIQSWRRAISRYFGADREGKYWRKAYAQWSQFHAWFNQGPDVLRKKVTEKSLYSATYHRKLRAARTAQASNP